MWALTQWLSAAAPTDPSYWSQLGRDAPWLALICATGSGIVLWLTHRLSMSEEARETLRREKDAEILQLHAEALARERELLAGIVPRVEESVRLAVALPEKIDRAFDSVKVARDQREEIRAEFQALAREIERSLRGRND